MEQERRDRQFSPVAAAALIAAVVVMVAVATLMDPAVSLALLTIVLVFGLGGWFLMKAMGFRNQPLSHGGRSYEDTHDDERGRGAA